MERLSRLRQAQIGGKRAPHKPLLLLWLFGRFAATGSARASYAEAAGPVSQLINDFGPSVASPALERQRAAMPFVHLERDLWDLRDDRDAEIPPDVPETGRWLLDHGAVGQLRPDVTAVLDDGAALAAAARLLLDQHFTPALSEMICANVGLDLPELESPQTLARPVRRPRASGFAEEVLRAYAYQCAMCGFDGRLGR
ncbi:MAG: restriction endonuclease, partial [Actinobacteria bacterium]|nr:restriction endonuclease [Actinomycetota bacterium]